VRPTGQDFWHWSITVQFPAGMNNGKSDSRGEAMADFRAMEMLAGSDRF